MFDVRGAIGARSSVLDPRFDLLARAITRVYQTSPGEHVHSFPIDPDALALADEREVRPVAEPLEVFENAGLVLRTAALAIVVFDTEKHVCARSPHVLRVEHVPEVQPSGGSGCEARDHWTSLTEAGGGRREAGFDLVASAFRRKITS
jgi:hypothetical protein